MEKSLRGIIPIVAAPFTSTGKLDEDSFQHLVRHLLGTGIHGMTLFGLATEFYKLTDEEKKVMQRIFLAETCKYPTVASIISITDHAAETALLHALEAEAQGADALMVLPPFFLQPGEDAILTHIRAVASNVTLPVIVQYAPNQTGVRLSPDVFLRLCEACPTIRFIKVETQPPGRYVSQLIAGSEGKLGAFVGYAGVQMPDVLDRGAVGIQPGCSLSEVYVQLFHLYEAGKRPAFDTLFREVLPYIAYWMQAVELIIKAEKVILQRRGIIASAYCREPYYTLDALELQMIDHFLEWFQSGF